jgi:hypothetical protein
MAEMMVFANIPKKMGNNEVYLLFGDIPIFERGKKFDLKFSVFQSYY